MSCRLVGLFESLVIKLNVINVLMFILSGKLLPWGVKKTIIMPYAEFQMKNAAGSARMKFGNKTQFFFIIFFCIKHNCTEAT